MTNKPWPLCHCLNVSPMKSIWFHVLWERITKSQAYLKNGPCTPSPVKKVTPRVKVKVVPQPLWPSGKVAVRDPICTSNGVTEGDWRNGARTINWISSLSVGEWMHNPLSVLPVVLVQFPAAAISGDFPKLIILSTRASVAENGSMSPQRHRATCRYRGGSLRSNRGQTEKALGTSPTMRYPVGDLLTLG